MTVLQTERVEVIFVSLKKAMRQRNLRRVRSQLFTDSNRFDLQNYFVYFLKAAVARR